MACPMPDTLAFEDAAVLPLAVSTAACGLFQSDQLGLQHPSTSAKPRSENALESSGPHQQLDIRRNGAED